MGGIISKKTGRLHLSPGRASKRGRVVIEAKATLKTLTAPEIQDEARKAGVAAIKALRRIVKSKVASDLAIISAAQTLLDRGFGKPTQTNINASVNGDGKPSEVTEQELNKRIGEALRRVEGITKRKREKIKSPPRPADIRQFH